MRRCPVNFEVVKAMLPLIFVMGTINIIAKTGINHAPSHNGVAVYIIIQSALVVLISKFFNCRNAEKETNILKDTKLLKTSFVLSILSLGVIALRLYGFILTPNPAYVTAIMLTGPFWVMLFYKIVKHEEKGDIKPGIGIVISAILLTLLVTK